MVGEVGAMLCLSSARGLLSHGHSHTNSSCWRLPCDLCHVARHSTAAAGLRRLAVLLPPMGCPVGRSGLASIRGGVTTRWSLDRITHLGASNLLSCHYGNRSPAV